MRFIQNVGIKSKSSGIHFYTFCTRMVIDLVNICHLSVEKKSQNLFDSEIGRKLSPNLSMTRTLKSTTMPHTSLAERYFTGSSKFPANTYQVISMLFSPAYTTEYGQCFQCDSLEFMKQLPNNSISLVLTSPPFPMLSKKPYGNVSQSEYVEWFLPFSQEIKRILTDNGSFVLDLRNVYLPKQPVKSLYIYDLIIKLVREQGYFLCQEFFFFNPTSMPCGQWVTIQRIRCKDAVNHVFWLSKTPFPKAENKKILQPYAQVTRKRIAEGYEVKEGKKPSGHHVSRGLYKDNFGAISSNLLTISNAESNSKYLNKCRELALTIHPARFPKQFAEFFIKFLTVEEGDTVLDPFSGSGTTPFVAQSLGRKWLACELMKEYVDASYYRFSEN